MMTHQWNPRPTVLELALAGQENDKRKSTGGWCEAAEPGTGLNSSAPFRALVLARAQVGLASLH